MGGNPTLFEYFDSMPKSRSYVHHLCGGCTTVMDNEDGKRGEDGMHPTPHSALSRPGVGRGKTYCATCEDFFDFDQFVWEDTGENLLAYKHRWFSKMPKWAQIVHGRTGCLFTLILAALITAGLGYALISAWSFGFGSISLTLVGGVIILVILGHINDAIGSSLERKYYGVTEFRLLK